MRRMMLICLVLAAATALLYLPGSAAAQKSESRVGITFVAPGTVTPPGGGGTGRPDRDSNRIIRPEDTVEILDPKIPLTDLGLLPKTGGLLP